MSKEFTARGKKFFFPFMVTTYVLLDDRIIVCSSWSKLKVELPELDDDRPIWCYDLEGNLLWQIEKPYYTDLVDSKRYYDCAFMAVGCSPDTREVFAWTSERKFHLDPNTGKISNEYADPSLMR